MVPNTAVHSPSLRDNQSAMYGVGNRADFFAVYCMQLLALDGHLADAFSLPVKQESKRSKKEREREADRVFGRNSRRGRCDST